ncbi:unnamed protein product [Moneuplotes crassus]|uniref:Uncharacterized protein n=1 Tax=Euplotes crassus TaxID=5936 RepID=A0AAD1YB19_EUPCR|nr:unnamed protein product [Moneuplotes crassus]
MKVNYLKGFVDPQKPLFFIKLICLCYNIAQNGLRSAIIIIDSMSWSIGGLVVLAGFIRDLAKILNLRIENLLYLKFR